MNCNCKWTESILGLAIFVVTLWPSLLNAMLNKWIVILAAVLLVMHAWGCHNCACMKEMPKKKKR